MRSLSLWVIASTAIVSFIACGEPGKQSDCRKPGDCDSAPPLTSASSADSAPVPPSKSLGLWAGTANGSRHGRQSGAPVALDIDGDGIEEALGFFLGSAQPGAPMFVAAADARTQALRWVGPPLAANPEKPAPLMDVVDQRIVATSPDGNAIALNAVNGAVVAKQSLSGYVARICAVGPHLVRLVQDNDVAWDFDATRDSFASSNDKCPADVDPYGASSHFGPPPPELPQRFSYERDGVVWRARAADGVVVKAPNPRTRSVELRLEAKEGDAKPVWSVALEDETERLIEPVTTDIFEVHGDEVLVDLRAGKGDARLEWPKPSGVSYLASYDVKTGRPRWRTRLPKDSGSPSNGMVVTASVIMFSRLNELDFFDRKTGKSLGYIGWH